MENAQVTIILSLIVVVLLMKDVIERFQVNGMIKVSDVQKIIAELRPVVEQTPTKLDDTGLDLASGLVDLLPGDSIYDESLEENKV